MIGHEERVETAALERLRESLQMREVEIGIGVRVREAPRARMETDGGA